jgi:hypothetical protein
MPPKPVDLDTVRAIVSALPDVEESAGARGMGFKVGGNLLTWTPINRSAEPGSLAVRIDFDLRAGLLAAEPDVYYLTPHYEKHPVVLVRLGNITRESLRKLLDTAWLFVTSDGPKAAKKRKKSIRKRR